MLILVTGGAASGKSAWAEETFRLLCRQREETGERFEKTYVATMQPFGAEAEARIRKHRNRRKADGFRTAEQYLDLREITLPQDGSVLLDCMGNLVANERFREDLPEPGTHLVSRVMQGVETVCRQSADVVLVTNEVFSGGTDYAGETLDYMRLLGEVNCRIADRADIVCEVVCGIPHIVKGTL